MTDKSEDWTVEEARAWAQANLRKPTSAEAERAKANAREKGWLVGERFIWEDSSPKNGRRPGY